ncbi:MAG: hypothetical protein O3A85_08480 [Proteobacteria bacterium]|nr:hypothetical protein [Pseudomonadota bacterium]
MRFLFYLGGILLLLAFAGAAAEAIPRSMPGGAAYGGLFVSAYEIWYAASPGSLVVSQIHIERLSPALWDPLVVGLLSAPAWFLFGLPGALLTWRYRPHKEMTAEQLDDLKKHEDTLFLFDELVRDARDAGYDNAEDDQAPTHGDRDSIDILETEGGATPYSEDAVIEHLELDEGGATDAKG